MVEVVVVVRPGQFVIVAAHEVTVIHDVTNVVLVTAESSTSSSAYLTGAAVVAAHADTETVNVYDCGLLASFRVS